MNGGIGRPKTRMSRKQLVTTKSGKTYYKYIYDDAQVRRSRPTSKKKITSATELIRKGRAMTRKEFEQKYSGKSYKKYREKLKRVKERL